MRFIKSIPEFVVGLPALAAFAADAGGALLLLIIASGFALALGGAYLSWRRFRYGVGARDVVIESGVFSRQRRVIPFDRVQDIEIEQGPLARLFGIVTVRIETGGGGKDEGRLDAVSRTEANRLRDIIRSRGGAAGEAVVAAAEPVLFAMSLPRVLLAGLFGFSLIFLGFIGIAFQNLQPLLRARGIDPMDLAGVAENAAGQMTVAGIAALAALLLALGVIAGLIRSVTRDYGFRLLRAPAGLRRKRGLLTRTDVVIPRHRIQLALIRSGLVERWLGWFALDFQTLGAGGGKSGHQPAAPFARHSEIEPILRETGHADLPPPDAYIRVSRRAVAYRAGRVLLPLLIPAAIISIAVDGGALILLLFPILIAGAVLHWRRHRYALTDRALVVVEGILRRRQWIVPFGNAQAFAISASPLQRAFGLASVAVDTAGAGVIHHPVIADLDAPVAHALGTTLLERFKAARAQLREAR